MKKLGVYIGRDQLRNDINLLLEHFSKQVEVVIFTPNDLEGILKDRLSASIFEFRNVRVSKGFIMELWDFIYKYFGYLPKYLNNYYIIKLFIINNIVPVTRRIWAKVQFQLILKFPKFLSFDAYLNMLNLDDVEVNLNGVEHMFFFTELPRSFLAKCIYSELNVACYVYSWDHPPKFSSFSKKINYFTWSNNISGDLADSWNIDIKKINVVGSSQFTFIKNYFKNRSKLFLDKPYKFEYVYFVCATAYDSLVKQEVDFVYWISKIITKLDLPYKIVFRPYPNLKNWGLYSPLEKLPGVVFDNDFKADNFQIREDKIYDRYWKIDHSSALIHFGTTLGLEACFFDSPSLIIDISDKSKLLNKFVHQYQNEKYLLLNGYDNVIQSFDELETTLINLESMSASLLEYNRAVVESFELNSMKDISFSLLQAMKFEKSIK